MTVGGDVRYPAGERRERRCALFEEAERDPLGQHFCAGIEPHERECYVCCWFRQLSFPIFTSKLMAIPLLSPILSLHFFFSPISILTLISPFSLINEPPINTIYNVTLLGKKH